MCVGSGVKNNDYKHEYAKNKARRRQHDGLRSGAIRANGFWLDGWKQANQS